MQHATAATASLRPASALKPRARGARNFAVCCAAEPQEPVSRRAALSGLAAIPALLAAAPALAFGKDVRQAMREKEERKAKLKAAAEKMKSQGKSTSAFASSEYSLPEDVVRGTPTGIKGD